MDICSNAAGDSYVTGYFTNSSLFQNTYLSSSSAGIPDGFIYKTNSNGQMQWIKKFGGPGSDRGIQCKVDSNNDIVITGYFYGSVIFGNTTLTSVANSQDVFIAKLDPNGNYLWATSLGGNLTDAPYGLAIDANNNIILTGSFQGTASFGTQTYTTAIHPVSNASSHDVFTTKISSTGNVVWTRTGMGKYDNRGLNVSTDSQNNVYVCGQFSDTISFNNQHANQIMNAVFLIKYSSSGNEVWFKKASASSAIAYGLAVDNNDNVIMSGDFTGNLIFFAPQNNALSGNYFNKIFISKFSPNGNFIWGKSESSNNYLSARDIVLDATGDIYLLGEFSCGFTEYQNNIAQGVFNSVGYKDLFVSKYSSSNGNRIWERQIGGPSHDKGHGISLVQNNLPLIAGSYFNKFSMPSGNLFNLYPNSLVYQNYAAFQNNNHCSETSYGFYVTAYGTGFSDAIAGTLIDLSRSTYDYYLRDGLSCLRPFKKSCIDKQPYTSNCPDSLKICPNHTVYAVTQTGFQGLIGPYHRFNWNTGDTIHRIVPTTNGVYHVTVTTMDGCFSSTDSVYVTVNSSPPVPKITDTKGFNFQQLPITNKIRFCSPDSVKITASNLFNNSFYWVGTPIMSSPDSSIWVNKVGINTYSIFSVNSHSCTSVNSVTVQIDTLYNVLPKISLSDTVTFCCGQGTFVNVYDSITNPNATNACIKLFDAVTWIVQPAQGNVQTLNNCNKPEDGIFKTCTTGQYTLTAILTVSNTCGTLSYTTSKVVYAVVNPNPTLSLSYSGTTQICPGDSTLITINASHPFQWNIYGSITSSNFTSSPVYIKIPGNYYVSSSVINTLTGCSNFQSMFIPITSKPSPYLSLSPNLICPNDSALLNCWAPNGINFNWIGPQGPIPGNTNFKWVNVAGFYHVVVTYNDGCVLTSNTKEVKKYNTPYITALPSPYICPNGTTTIKVVASDTTLIQWLPPLSGGGTTKTVSATGIYSCQVTMCNITTICTVQILQANPTASISVSQFSICPGDSVILTGNPNMATYIWQPGSQSNSVISVFEGGNYTLTTTDIHGCSATASISINMYNLTPLPVPSLSSYTICYGTSTVVMANSTGTVNWYTSQAGGNPFYSGNTYTTSNLFNQTTYYISNTDTNHICPSVRVPVYIYINPASLPVTASVSTPSVCAGDTIKFFASNVSSGQYNWLGINNFSSNIQNPFIYPATSANNGAYQFWSSGGGCSSNTVVVNVTVTTVSSPSISGNLSVCEGDTIILNAINSNNNSSLIWSGPNSYTYSGTSLTIAPSQTIHTGNYDLTVVENGCQSEPVGVFVTVNNYPVIQPNYFYPVCEGDTAILFANVSNYTSLNWTGPNNFSTNQNPYLLTPVNSVNSGTYYISATNNGCVSGPDSVIISHYPLPQLNLGPDTTHCFQTSPVTLTVASYPYILWQDNSSQNFINVLNVNGSYSVMVIDTNGCKNSDQVYLNFIECDTLFIPNLITPNGDGKNDYFKLRGEFYRSYKLEIYSRWGQLVYQHDNYDDSWNGQCNRCNGNSANLPTGTYFYVVEFNDGKKERMKGFVMLAY
jgi:gliding motility-associated-like protein